MCKKPYIVILRGPPASGKTSVSLVLKEKFLPAARISVDVLRYLVSPRNFSFSLLKAIKTNAARLAGFYAEEGISSIIESAFVSGDIIEQICLIIRSFGFTPFVFTLVVDEKTVIERNLKRELFDQMDPKRLNQLFQDYEWNIGQQVFVKGKEIEEVAAEIAMHVHAKNALPFEEKWDDDSQYVLFLRHGHASNHPDIYQSDYEKPLSAYGEQQAESISSAITLFNPDAVYCSSFLRAKMTVTLACKNIDKPIIEIEGLVERSFPSLYGKTKEEIIAQFPLETVAKLRMSNELVEIAGEETLQEAKARVVKEMDAILQRGDKKILIVSHGGPHSWLCCNYLGIDLSLLRQFTLDEAHFSLFQFNHKSEFQRIITLNAKTLPLMETKS